MAFGGVIRYGAQMGRLTELVKRHQRRLAYTVVVLLAVFV
jgi:hypothetical protein